MYSLAGNIGAGKTTMARCISERLGIPILEENVAKSEYLPDFYLDKKRWSFPLQIDLLRERLSQHQRMSWGDGGIQDRSIYEDQIFIDVLVENGDMTSRERRTYLQLFEMLSKSMRRPDAIIYLYVRPEVALERVSRRIEQHPDEREMEKPIDIRYLTQLHNSYERHMDELSKSITVIKVDWNEFGKEDEVIATLQGLKSEKRMIIV